MILGRRSYPSFPRRRESSLATHWAPAFAGATALLALAAALITPPANAQSAPNFSTPITLGRKSRPNAVAAAASQIYVLSSKKSLLYIYSTSGQLISTVGARQGAGKGLSFDEPMGLAIAPDGRVYVADTDNHRIVILDKDGAFLKAFGAKGSKRGSFNAPTSVAIDKAGRVYVSDSKNSRVEVFTSEGIFLYRFGAKGSGDGEFKKPTRIAVDPAGFIYVLDPGGPRIEQFKPTTEYVQELPIPGGDGDFALDRYGFIYVLDYSEGQVLVENINNSQFGKFGSYGKAVGQLKYPEGIALSPDGEKIWIADTYNDRVQSAPVPTRVKSSLIAEDARPVILPLGPAAERPIAASLLASEGSSLYAYLSGPGRFTIIDDNGNASLSFGSRGHGPSQTRRAGGMAFSSKLGLFVSDTDGDRVQHFDGQGAWKGNFGERKHWYESRTKDGYVNGPEGIAINEQQGLIYVADTGNKRVEAFDPNGKFVFKIGPHFGQYDLEQPTALLWNAKESALYILDRGLNKVFKCGAQGNFIAELGGQGSEPGQFEAPASMATDGDRLYVLDEKLDRVSVFDADGHWATDMFAPGLAPEELSHPVSMALLGNRLVIADQGKGKEGELVSFGLQAPGLKAAPAPTPKPEAPAPPPAAVITPPENPIVISTPSVTVSTQAAMEAPVDVSTPAVVVSTPIVEAPEPVEVSTPAVTVSTHAAPAAPIVVSSAPAAPPPEETEAPQSAMELMGWFGRLQESVGKSSAPDKDKADLSKAIQFILDGDLETGREGLEAFKKAHPSSPLRSDAAQAESKLKKLQKAEEAAQ